MDEMCAPSGSHSVIFDRLDGEMIRRVTIQMNGAAVPYRVLMQQVGNDFVHHLGLCQVIFVLRWEDLLEN